MKVEVTRTGHLLYTPDREDETVVREALLLAKPEHELMDVMDIGRSDMGTDDLVTITEDDGTILWTGYL